MKQDRKYPVGGGVLPNSQWATAFHQKHRGVKASLNFQGGFLVRKSYPYFGRRLLEVACCVYLHPTGMHSKGVFTRNVISY